MTQHYQLDVEQMESVQVYKQTAWAVLLTVTSDESVSFPPEVFVFQTDGPGPAARGFFKTVATPADLLEYPTDAPAIENGAVQQPFFRLNSVQFVSRNPDDIEQLIRMVRRRLTILETNLTAINQLGA